MPIWVLGANVKGLEGLPAACPGPALPQPAYRGATVVRRRASALFA